MNRPGKVEVRLKVNGQWHEAYVEPRKLLSDFIRQDVGLTGTHVGCEHGVCGACTVVVNGQLVKACLMLAVQAREAEIITVEGLAQGDQLHPMQRAFTENHALQCGFCTPGMLLSAISLLEENPHPSEEEIRLGMDGNLCRCTGYYNIVKAIQAAADSGESIRLPAVGASKSHDPTPNPLPREGAELFSSGGQGPPAPLFLGTDKGKQL